jgi:hypothetical protein
MKHDESDLHKAFFEWAQYHPKIEQYLFGIEHGISYGTNKRRNFAIAASLKKRGVKPGILDFVFLQPNSSYSSLYIEFKIKPNKLTLAQKRFIVLAEDCGHKCVCAYSLDEAISLLNKYIANKL